MIVIQTVIFVANLLLFLNNTLIIISQNILYRQITYFPNLLFHISLLFDFRLCLKIIKIAETDSKHEMKYESLNKLYMNNSRKKKSVYSFLIPFFILFLVGCESEKVIIKNPIIDGYYADPSIIFHDGLYYIYATKDPWGGDDLAVFETSDFRNFTTHEINWPTKEACTSPTSGDSKVWAPSVIKGNDGKFYMYVSVGSEVWAGKSEYPLGPWKNIKNDNSPLIERNMFPGYHMIDAEAFIDDDGQAYLYWGSGLNWVNGACFGVKLAPDMHTFMGDPENITPPNFFEAPVMFKKDEIYYLMYSDGKAIDATYKIRYSVGETPFGPWKEGKNSPVLQTTADSTIVGPGHNTVFQKDGQYYILYHKIFPQTDDYVLRQLCIDSLNFDSEKNIEKIRSNGIIF